MWTRLRPSRCRTRLPGKSDAVPQVVGRLLSSQWVRQDMSVIVEYSSLSSRLANGSRETRYLARITRLEPRLAALVLIMSGQGISAVTGLAASVAGRLPDLLRHQQVHLGVFAGR